MGPDIDAARLSGKVEVVTGGASGIGRSTVLRFLAEGAKVMVGDLNMNAADQLVSDAAASDRLHVIRTDVSEEAEVEALIGAATDRFGRLDIVFNNAGIGGAFGPITEIDVDDWDRTFAILTRSVFLGIKHGARALIEQGHGGSIINTASVAGLAGGSGPQAYSAAKAAVINLTLSTADELARYRIRVNAICPGVIFTPLAMGRHPERLAEAVAALQPWPDHGSGDDIASAALWLASDESHFVTGDAIRVDGGLLAAGTRISSGSDPYRVWQRYAGFAYGTSGKPAHRRSVEAKEPNE
jgi:NAD(P)-dependent dehydrogenase (short-subunit alcohol dehydrogenase family)